jgi:hypothetical protein
MRASIEFDEEPVLVGEERWYDLSRDPVIALGPVVDERSSNLGDVVSGS